MLSKLARGLGESILFFGKSVFYKKTEKKQRKK